MLDMEIQVGEYVRTPEGIRKILGEIETKYIYGEKVAIFYEYEIDKLFKESLRLTEEELEIFPHSINPIDLIEVGDYVNGERIAYITISKQGEKLLMTDGGYILQGKYQSITSIITKEQFESIKYEV